MRSKLLFLSTTIIFSYSTFINAQWIRQTNGLSEDWGVGWAIDASDSNNALFSTNFGLFRTTDGGNNWIELALPDTITETVIDVSITDDLHFWVATALGKIIRTTDAGKSWTVQFSDESKTQFMNYIEMFDEMNGVAMGDAPFPAQKKPAVFLKTTDSGNTWIQSPDTTLIDVVSGDTWRRVDFVNPTVGYFYVSGINPEKLYKTTDGCASWSTTNFQGYAAILKCYDENIILTSSNFGNVSRTTDGGSTWNESLLASGWGNDIEFIPGNASKVFFTDGDKLFFSSDTGKSWQEVFVDNIEIKARDIVFPDQYHGWILGDSGRVYKTSVGGISENYIASDYIAANEILMWIGNNGMGSHDPRTDGSGFYWPGGENATLSAIFEDGLVWGGKVNGEIRVNGSTYRRGLKPGYILPNGLASDPLEVKSKIFKLKKNWQLLPPSSERNRYQFDYLNWPVDVGAPWKDKNGDGVYTSGIDEPKIIGNETLFFVANDLDTTTSKYTYGSNPIGLEFQVTTFGYDTELLKDVVFKKYKMINKSQHNITDMYLTYWTDDDLGLASDDYIGCDTILNLGYTYNADNNDQGFYGTPPPAVGHLMVQPPIMPAESIDSARYGEGWRNGYRNILMHSFQLFTCGGLLFCEPNLGEYTGTLEWYNLMQGLLADGSPIIDPITNLQTRFCLAGDPVFGTGWYEGNGWPGGPNSGDRKFAISSGPFNMAPSDTQEVVIALLIKKGTDNINSITQLKNYATHIQHWYDNDFVVDVEEVAKILPLEFSLLQNYPNPFNPSTVICWQSPVGSWQTLKVYDVLGNEVATLVDEYKPAGKYEVNFDASKLSSGVYFYRLQTSNFVETKKMLVLK